MTARRLDHKLEAIAAGRYTPADFILADAKDADMAFGITAPGVRPDAPGRYRSRQDYLSDMRAQIAQGDLDIVLTSASNGEALADGSSWATTSPWPSARTTPPISGTRAAAAIRPRRPDRSVR